MKHYSTKKAGQTDLIVDTFDIVWNTPLMPWRFRMKAALSSRPIRRTTNSMDTRLMRLSVEILR